MCARTRDILGGARDRVKDLRAHPRTKSEAMIIAMVERATGKKFPTVYPAWLRMSPRASPLELDGYCAELGIAIEFQGPQHTKWFTREPYAEYAARIERDKAKVRICAKHGVSLIVIDNEVLKLSRDTIERYIKSRLQDIGAATISPDQYVKKIEVDAWVHPAPIN